MNDAYFCTLFKCIAKHTQSKKRANEIITVASHYIKSHISQKEMRKTLRLLATKEEISLGLREFQREFQT